MPLRSSGCRSSSIKIRWPRRFRRSAKVYLAQADFVHAEPDLLKAIELDPNLEPAYLMLAQLYVATNKQDEAVAKLTAYVKEHKDIPALTQFATIQEQLKNYLAARDIYEQLLAISANYLPALNNLAVIYSEHLGDAKKAFDFARKAREVAPNAATADTLGWIFFKRGEYGTALPLLQESAARLAAVPDIQFHLGIGQYMLGQEDSARVALQKAVETNTDFPDSEEARARLALLAIDPRYADASKRAELDNYLRRQPNDPGALARRAQLHQLDGKPDQAIQTYEKIIATDPFHAPTARELAILYAERPADAAKAYDFAQKARQLIRATQK